MAWEDGSGRVLVRYGGNTAAERARETAARMELEAVEFTEDDGALWDAQRARQRRTDGAVLKVSGRPTDLANVIRAAGGASVASRAALGPLVAGLRARRRPRIACGDRPPGARAAQLHGARRRRPRRGRSGPTPVPGQVVMDRLKSRFDPARIFRPGAFVGGI